ncbi:hypothetical protein [Agromyces humi]|uniref:hypothetical protein n=1 Tax=Agromyces humi TaxID=1766800 RepID=UPI00135744D9|nr:hypothetical protein [Agromyces humi]
MDSAAPYVPVITGSATAERLDAARRHLLVLASLSDSVRLDQARLIPSDPTAWRSDATIGYVERLDNLRAGLAKASSLLSDAESSLRQHVRNLEFELAGLERAGTR